MCGTATEVVINELLKLCWSIVTQRNVLWVSMSTAIYLWPVRLCLVHTSQCLKWSLSIRRAVYRPRETDLLSSDVVRMGLLQWYTRLVGLYSWMTIVLHWVRVSSVCSVQSFNQHMSWYRWLYCTAINPHWHLKRVRGQHDRQPPPVAHHVPFHLQTGNINHDLDDNEAPQLYQHRYLETCSPFLF